MKTKPIAAIMVTMILAMSVFYILPVQAAELKIGYLGPMVWPQGEGIKEGLTMAAEKINTMGGVDVGGTSYTITLEEATTSPGGEEPTETDGRNAMSDLVDAGAFWVIGGFRSESVYGAREVAADHGVGYTITGAATNELIDCGTGTCGECVRCDYERYNRTFRATPTNSSTLFKTIAAYFQSVLLGPWIYLAPTGAAYLDNDASLTVSPGDLRLTNYPPSGTPIYPKYSIVQAGDADVGGPLDRIPGPPGILTRSVFASDEGMRKNAYGNLYYDNDASTTVSAGDLRASPAVWTYDAWTVVAGGDNDVGMSLSVFPQVRFASIVEMAIWADIIWYYFTTEGVYQVLLGPYAKYAYGSRPSPAATNFDTELDGIIDNDCKLIVHIFSAEAGLAFMIDWAAAGSPALPVGIDVVAQLNTHWDDTSGACEGECTLVTTGTRTPMTTGGSDGWGRFGNPGTVTFWDDYVTRWGHYPIYTAWGAYDALISLAETIERVDTLDYDTIVAELETLDRQGLVSRFKFTFGNAANPGGHDVFCNEASSTWTQGFSRPLMGQWQDGRMEVTFPTDQPYSKLPWLPPSMYPWRADIDVSKGVDIFDALWTRASFGTEPGDLKWNSMCDVVSTGASEEVVDIYDALEVRKRFGKTVPYTL